jgi:hypothetical protein
VHSPDGIPSNGIGIAHPDHADCTPGLCRSQRGEMSPRRR